MRVVIDPGHGAPDPGARGRMSNEADINLDVAVELSKILSSMGIVAPLTRTGPKRIHRDNRNLDLSARPAMANRLKADAFISIHCNGAVAPEAHGFEIYTTPGQNNSDKLATAIFESWAQCYPEQRKRTDYRDGDPDKEANLKVLREANCPAVLVELGFITNPTEERFLLNKMNQEIMGLAIATGIHNFFEGLKG
jgi:N-acetylmuramoyl-L-alanine amidase